MSNRQAIFKGFIPIPQSVARYLVVVNPLMPVLSVLVEAASYPSVRMGEVALPFKGRKVYRPTVPEVDGNWKVRASDSVFQLLKNEIIISTSTPFNNKLKTIAVLPLGAGDIPMPGVKLMDVWLKGRDEVSLDSSNATEVWKWNIHFKYSMIEEYSLSSVVNNVLNEIIL